MFISVLKGSMLAHRCQRWSLILDGLCTAKLLLRLHIITGSGSLKWSTALRRLDSDRYCALTRFKYCGLRQRHHRLRLCHNFFLGCTFNFAAILYHTRFSWAALPSLLALLTIGTARLRLSMIFFSMSVPKITLRWIEALYHRLLKLFWFILKSIDTFYLARCLLVRFLRLSCHSIIICKFLLVLRVWAVLMWNFGQSDDVLTIYWVFETSAAFLLCSGSLRASFLTFEAFLAFVVHD